MATSDIQPTSFDAIFISREKKSCSRGTAFFLGGAY
jgi:hypothetical protein